MDGKGQVFKATVRTHCPVHAIILTQSVLCSINTYRATVICQALSEAQRTERNRHPPILNLRISENGAELVRP